MILLKDVVSLVLGKEERGLVMEIVRGRRRKRLSKEIREYKYKRIGNRRGEGKIRG